MPAPPPLAMVPPPWIEQGTSRATMWRKVRNDRELVGIKTANTGVDGVTGSATVRRKMDGEPQAATTASSSERNQAGSTHGQGQLSWA